MTPIYQQSYLDFAKRDLVVCVADTVEQAADHASQFVELNMQPGDIGGAESLCITMPNGATALLFSRGNLTAASICHLAVDATAGILLKMGVEMNEGSVSAYSYFADMLFREVAELLKENRVKINLL